MDATQCFNGHLQPRQEAREGPQRCLCQECHRIMVLSVAQQMVLGLFVNRTEEALHTCAQARALREWHWKRLQKRLSRKRKRDQPEDKGEESGKRAKFQVFVSGVDGRSRLVDVQSKQTEKQLVGAVRKRFKLSNSAEFGLTYNRGQINSEEASERPFMEKWSGIGELSVINVVGSLQGGGCISFTLPDLNQPRRQKPCEGRDAGLWVVHTCLTEGCGSQGSEWTHEGFGPIDMSEMSGKCAHSKLLKLVLIAADLKVEDGQRKGGKRDRPIHHTAPPGTNLVFDVPDSKPWRHCTLRVTPPPG